jgi:hypothetical protein
MIITCPHCKSSKDIGDVNIPKTGAAATCISCHRQFDIHSEHNVSDPVAINTCPSCGLDVESRNETEICSRCGLVFSKYLARTAQLSVLQNLSQESVPTVPQSALRRLLGNTFFWGLTLALLLAAFVRFGHDWKLDKNYRLETGNWQGEMLFRGKQHPFLLVIQSTESGKLEGYMDWIETMPRYRLAIRGTHTGNHLLFEDYKFLEGEGQYGLHDNQDVYIIENEMSGTAKNGNATLHAVKVATSPDSARELRNY